MCRIGFIGAGNMGGAIIDGIIKSGNFKKENIFVCEKMPSEEIKSLNVNICSMEDAVKASDCVVLAVKPNIIGSVLEEIKKVNGYENKVYISIAAGYKTENIQSFHIYLQNML